MKAKATWIEEGATKPASDKIMIQYQLNKYDPATGAYTPSAPSIKPPDHLSVGDKLVIELVPRDKEHFVLSSPVKITLLAKDFLISTHAVTEIPPVSFMGENGAGTLIVNSMAPPGFQWEYQIFNSNKDLISGNQNQWLSSPPSDLSNGDFVKVRIAANSKFSKNNQGGKALTSQFIKVIGLAKVINVADIQLDKTAFKLNGVKNTDGSLEVVREAAPQGIRYKYIVIKTDKDGKKSTSVVQLAPPDHLSNGDVVKISIESSDPRVRLIGSKEIEFKIKDLDVIESKSASSRLMTIMLVVGGITLALVTAGGIFFMKKRRINKLG